MSDFFDDIPDAPRRAPRTKPGARVEGVDPALLDFAARRDFTVTSGADSLGTHVRGSLHGGGRAVDLRVSDKRPEDISRALADARAAGLHAAYERKGQGNATGDHIHLSVPGAPQADSFFDDVPDAPPAPMFPKGLTRGVVASQPAAELPPQAPPATPSRPPQPTVTSRVLTPEEEEAALNPPLSEPSLKPFDPDKGLSVPAVLAQKAQRITQRPAGYDEGILEPVSATVHTAGEKPSPSEAVDALMEQLGSGWRELAQKYRAETGREPIDVRTLPEPEAFDYRERGTNWRYSISPSRDFIDTMKAYQAGGLEPASRIARERAEAKTVGLNKAAQDEASQSYLGQVATDVVKGLGKTVQGTAQLAENLRKIHEGEAFDDSNQSAIDEARARMPAYRTNLGAVLGTGAEVVGDVARMEASPLGAVVEQFVENVNRGGLEAAKSAGAIAALQAVGVGGDKVAQILELSPAERQVFVRALQGDVNAAQAAMQGEKGAALLKSFGVGAAFPVGKGERVERDPVAPKIAPVERTARQSYLDLPDIPVGTIPAPRVVRAMPETAPETSTPAPTVSRAGMLHNPETGAPLADFRVRTPERPRVVKGAAAPPVEGQPQAAQAPAEPLAEPVRHVDLQKRDDAGQFREETPREKSARQRRVADTSATQTSAGVDATPDNVTSALGAGADIEALRGGAQGLPDNASTGAPAVADGAANTAGAPGGARVDGGEGLSSTPDPQTVGGHKPVTDEPHEMTLAEWKQYGIDRQEEYRLERLAELDEFLSGRKELPFAQRPGVAEEYRAHYEKDRQRLSVPTKPENPKVLETSYIRHVGRAIDEGKPVSPETWADFLTLARKYGTAIPEKVNIKEDGKGERPAPDDAPPPRRVAAPRVDAPPPSAAAPAVTLSQAEVAAPRVSAPESLPRPRTAERSFPQSAEAAGLSKGTDTTYDVQADAPAVERASRRIESAGADRVMADITSNKEPSKDDIVAGQLLARKFSEAGDHEREVAVINDLAEKLTKAGQSVQAASLISRLSPEGVLLQGQRILNRRGANRTLTAEEVTGLKESAARVREYEAKVSDLQRQIEEMKLRPQSVGRQGTRQKIATITERLSQAEADARARLDARKAQAQELIAGNPQAGATAILPDLADYAIIYAAKLAKGTLNRAVLAGEMVKEFGEGIRPHLDDIRRQGIVAYREHQRAEDYDRAVARVTEGRPEDFTPEQIRELVQAERERGKVSARERAALRSEYLNALGPKQGPAKGEGLGAKEGPRLTEAPLPGPRMSESRPEGPGLSEGQGRTAGPRVTEAPSYGPRLSEGLKSGPSPARVLSAIAERSQGDSQKMMGAAKFSRPGMDAGTWAAEMKAEFGLEGKEARQAYRDSYELYKEANKAVREEAITRGAKDAADRQRLLDERLDAQTAARKARIELDRTFRQLSRSPARRALAVAQDTVGAARTVLTGGDVSFGLRQGKMAVRHPAMFVREWAKAWRALSETQAERLRSEMELHPDFKVMQKQMGMQFTSLGHSDPAMHEEGFQSRALEKLPIFKHVERVNAAMLDGLRFGWAKSYLENVRKMGLAPEAEAKALKEGGELIMDGTGRADLGRMGNALSPVLSNTLFSPRFWAARVKWLTVHPTRMMIPESWGGLSRPARVEAFKTLFAFSGVVATQLAVARAAGAQVDTDPDSPNFLKGRWGNMRVDFSAGFQGHIRVALRLAKTIAGQTKTAEGKPRQSGGKILETYGRGKLSPPASLFYDLYLSEPTKEGRGTDIVGQPVYPFGDPKKRGFDKVKSSALFQRVAPMLYRDAQEAYELMGWKAGAVAGVGSFIGEGVSAYGDKSRSGAAPSVRPLHTQSRQP